MALGEFFCSLLASALDLLTSSKVYKCTYEGKTCAVKKVPVSKGYQSFRSVMSELLVLSKVKHPRIVKFVNFYQTSKDWNFIIEYMANGSLRDLLNSRRKMKKLIGQDDVLELFMVRSVFRRLESVLIV